MVGMERRLSDDDQKKTVAVCWTCGEEKRPGEAGAGRKIKGKRQRERKRLDYMEGLALAAGCGAVDVLRRAGDRVGFRDLVANVRP